MRSGSKGGIRALNPQTDMDRTIDDVTWIMWRNNRSLWGFGSGPTLERSGLRRRAGSILDGHAERHYDDRKHEI